MESNTEDRENRRTGRRRRRGRESQAEIDAKRLYNLQCEKERLEREVQKIKDARIQTIEQKVFLQEKLQAIEAEIVHRKELSEKEQHKIQIAEEQKRKTGGNIEPRKQKWVYDKRALGEVAEQAVNHAVDSMISEIILRLTQEQINKALDGGERDSHTLHDLYNVAMHESYTTQDPSLKRILDIAVKRMVATVQTVVSSQSSTGSKGRVGSGRNKVAMLALREFSLVGTPLLVYNATGNNRVGSSREIKSCAVSVTPYLTFAELKSFVMKRWGIDRENPYFCCELVNGAGTTWPNAERVIRYLLMNAHDFSSGLLLTTRRRTDFLEIHTLIKNMQVADMLRNMDEGDHIAPLVRLLDKARKRGKGDRKTPQFSGGTATAMSIMDTESRRRRERQEKEQNRSTSDPGFGTKTSLGADGEEEINQHYSSIWKYDEVLNTGHRVRRDFLAFIVLFIVVLIALIYQYPVQGTNQVTRFLERALVGYTFEYMTPDGRDLDVNLNEVTSWDQVETWIDGPLRTTIALVSLNSSSCLTEEDACGSDRFDPDMFDTFELLNENDTLLLPVVYSVGQNVLVSKVRFRTSRVRSMRLSECDVDSKVQSLLENEFGRAAIECYPAYSISNREESNNSFEGTIVLNSSIREALTFRESSNKFLDLINTTPVDLDISLIEGDFARYDRSGYVFDTNAARWREDLGQVFGPNAPVRWLDKQTRLLAIEFNLFNPNLNIFVSVVIRIEAHESGRMSSGIRIVAFSVDTKNPLRDITLTVFFILVLLYMMLISIPRYYTKAREKLDEDHLKQYTKALRRSLKKSAEQNIILRNVDRSTLPPVTRLEVISKFLRNGWVLLDIAIVLLGILTLIFSGFVAFSDRLTNLSVDSTEPYTSLAYLGTFERVARICGAILFGFLCLKFFRYLALDHRFDSLLSTLSDASRPLVVFFFFFFTIFLGFIISGWQGFGSYCPGFHSFARSTTTLELILFARFDIIANILPRYPTLALLFVGTFFVVMGLILVKMPVAIITISYLLIKQRHVSHRNIFHKSYSLVKEGIGMVNSKIQSFTK